MIPPEWHLLTDCSRIAHHSTLTFLLLAVPPLPRRTNPRTFTHPDFYLIRLDDPSYVMLDLVKDLFDRFKGGLISHCL